MSFFDEKPDELRGVVTKPGEQMWVADAHCSRCDKRLTRKSARLIDGKVICAACLFPKLEKGMPQ